MIPKSFIAIQIKGLDSTTPQGVYGLAAGATKLANDLEVVPRPEARDRVLRADAATERTLNRATDRLERLQRHRKGEVVPPPLSVRFT